VTGYLSEELRRRIRQQAGDRCGYCLSPQYLVMGVLEIEHIVPKAAGGSDNEENLWLACRLCNSFKSGQTHGLDPQTGQLVQLFHPRTQTWYDQFEWAQDGTQIIGKTPCGRASVVVLQLNNLVAVTVRRFWVQAGWHPPGHSLRA
jgi:hypothetical protein